MSFTYETVTVSSMAYKVFATLAEAELYLAANIAAENWRTGIPSSDVNTKPMAIVTATRWLNVQNWQGEKTDETNELAFPRTGLLYRDGNTPVDPDTIPDLMKAATIELANLFVDNPNLRISILAPLPRELHAGPAGLSFFRPSNVVTPTPLPTIIMSLVGQWLAGVGATLGGESFGTDEKSRLEREADYTHGV